MFGGLKVLLSDLMRDDEGPTCGAVVLLEYTQVCGPVQEMGGWTSADELDGKGQLGSADTGGLGTLTMRMGSVTLNTGTMRLGKTWQC